MQDVRYKRFSLLKCQVLGKLKAEGLSADSPWLEIKACLSKTVAPKACINMAKLIKYRKTEKAQLAGF